MNTQPLQRIRSRLNRALLAATLFMMVSPLSAATIVQLQTDYSDYQVKERYTHDLDVLYQNADQARSAASREDTARNGGRHSWHRGIVIADVGTHVFSDFDQDGYFTHFSVSFDVDTGYGEAWVYARIYLREGSGDYVLFHTTEVFEIYGNLSTDRYKVESKLLANYPASYYDILIDVYVAGDTEIRDTVDATTHRNLFALPLESDLLDDGPRQEIIRGSIGSTTLTGLLALCLIALRRKVGH